VKDALLFTPPPNTTTATAAAGGGTTKRPLPPPCDTLLRTFPTDFGCTRLRRFRLSGDFIFPPMAARAKAGKAEAGPVVEVGLYAILLHLRHLQQFCFSFAPLAVARYIISMLCSCTRVPTFFGKFWQVWVGHFFADVWIRNQWAVVTATYLFI
jgi:hypothetical protein